LAGKIKEIIMGGPGSGRKKGGWKSASRKNGNKSHGSKIEKKLINEKRSKSKGKEY
jgi:hypothetical protein